MDNRPPLYPFQAEDIEILHRQILDRGVAVSHHEQGLGKSRMSVEIADRLKAKHVLVLCPAIARVSWAEEPKKWGVIPRKAVILKGSADLRKLDKIGSHPSIVTVTYDLCRSPKVQEKLRTFGFDFAILDEFQQLRTPTAKRTRAVYHRKEGVLAGVKKVMLMSGTPVVSWPMDLWTHLKRWGDERLTLEGTVMSDTQFLHRYHVTTQMPNPSGNRWAKPITKIVRARNLDDLHARLKGWAVRRRKTDVLKDLPPMVTRGWPVEVPASTRKQLLEDLRAELPPMLATALEAASTDIEVDRVMRQIAASSGHVSTVTRLLGMAKAAAVGKAVRDELAESTYKIGIFAWNVPVIDTLIQELRDYRPLVITGAVSAAQRAQAVRLFQEDPGHRVFIGQISACGTALTLTAASRCIFTQLSWTPGDNAQAAARFHRIGQKDSVDVRIAYMTDTIDTAVSRVLSTKSQAAWEVVDA